MKPKVMLALSLGLNLLLGLYFVQQRLTHNAPAGDETVPASRVTASLSARATPTTPGSPGAEPAPARTFTWELVESPDYREYITNLRSIGCPEETIRDIIVADVNKLYAAKKREMRGEPKQFEYWKAGNPWMSQLDSDYLGRMRALEEEKLGVLRQLGIEPDLKMQMSSFMDTAEALDTMFGFLPEEKQVRVMKIMQDMQADMAEAAQDGGFDPATIEASQRKMEAALKEALSPEEFRDYELRMSMTANSLRSQLAGWDPDEPEFLKVYELRKAFDEQFSMLNHGNESETERAKRREAETQLKDTLKQALGSERYAQYERAQDYGFQQIHQAAKRADLGTAEAVKVYEMRQAAEAEVRNLRQNTNLTPDQRNATLTGIQSETERSIKQVLGDKGWEQYNRGANTYWLNNMVPKPPPAEAPAVP